jgi:predicted esterase YcpF (UPF0227 family)
LTEKLELVGTPLGMGYTTSLSADAGVSSALAVPAVAPMREYAAAVAPAAWSRVRRDRPVLWASFMEKFLQ